MKHAVKWLAMSLLLVGAMACLTLLGPRPVAPASLPQPSQVPVAPAVPTPTELSQADEEAITKLNEAMDKAKETFYQLKSSVEQSNAEIMEILKQLETHNTTNKARVMPKIG